MRAQNMVAQHVSYGQHRGATTSRATSCGRRKDRNTSGQRGNKFNTSYRDISVVVAENNSIVKPISAPYNTTILDHVTGARLSCTNK